MAIGYAARLCRNADCQSRGAIALSALIFYCLPLIVFNIHFDCICRIHPLRVAFTECACPSFALIYLLPQFKHCFRSDHFQPLFSIVRHWQSGSARVSGRNRIVNRNAINDVLLRRRSREALQYLLALRRATPLDVLRCTLPACRGSRV